MSVVMLTFIMMKVVMLSVIMNVILLNVFLQNVIKLSLIMLRVITVRVIKKNDTLLSANQLRNIMLSHCAECQYVECHYNECLSTLSLCVLVVDRIIGYKTSGVVKWAPNKLQCYITLELKGFPVTNTLAYLTHSYVMKKMKCCEYSPWCQLDKTFYGRY